MYFALAESENLSIDSKKAGVVSSLLDDAISSIKEVSPKDMTDEDFLNKFSHDEEYEKKVISKLRSVFGLEEEEQNDKPENKKEKEK